MKVDFASNEKHLQEETNATQIKSDIVGLNIFYRSTRLVT